jgi:hypothetical protein
MGNKLVTQCTRVDCPKSGLEAGVQQLLRLGRVKVDNRFCGQDQNRAAAIQEPAHRIQIAGHFYRVVLARRNAEAAFYAAIRDDV